MVVDDVPELLPDAVRRALRRARRGHRAYDWIHAPEDRPQVARAHHRFRFEEALVTQLVLARRRRAIRELGATARTGGDGALQAGVRRAAAVHADRPVSARSASRSPTTSPSRTR